MTYLSAVLEYFDLAQNYRKYQHKLIKNFVKKKILEVGAGNGQIVQEQVPFAILPPREDDECELLEILWAIRGPKGQPPRRVGPTSH